MDYKKKLYSIEWLVIPAPDIQKARIFYSNVFNFQLTEYNESFTLFKAGNISGALDSSLKPSINSLSFSITVDDILEVSDKILQYGGVIIKETYSLGGNLGVCAQFADPNGNILELYSTK
ncbi:MAG: VOC family protein [Candidatus Cloacimonetes bacterium]|nr:VOC family protein [Candidatus Cloacimonadota bacterium]